MDNNIYNNVNHNGIELPSGKYTHGNGVIYEVILITNEYSENPRYPIMVHYQGPNGKKWSKTLDNFNRTMTKVEEEAEPTIIQKLTDEQVLEIVKLGFPFENLIKSNFTIKREHLPKIRACKEYLKVSFEALLVSETRTVIFTIMDNRDCAIGVYDLNVVSMEYEYDSPLPLMNQAATQKKFIEWFDN